MSCNNSNNTTPNPLDLTTQCDPCTSPCGCEEQPCATPEYETGGCVYTESSNCIQYDKGGIPCLDVSKGDSITKIIDQIVAKIATMVGSIPSTTLKVTSTGSCSKTITIDLEPSAQAGNILTLGADNKPYVPAPTTGDVIIQDTPYMTWNKTVVNGVITFVPTLDIAAITELVCTTCGGVAPCAEPEGLDYEDTQNVDGTTDVVLTWDEEVGVTYDVLLNNTLVEVGVESPYTVEGLEPDSTNVLSVKAHCSNGNVSTSFVIVTTDPTPECNAATTLVATIS